PAPDGGSVQFTADGKNLGGPVPVNPFTGQAIAQPVSTLAGGSHQVTASFLGDASYLSSESQPLTQPVISPQAITLPTQPPPGPPRPGSPVALRSSRKARRCLLTRLARARRNGSR